jgi:hypothetical protein
VMRSVRRILVVADSSFSMKVTAAVRAKPAEVSSHAASPVRINVISLRKPLPFSMQLCKSNVWLDG